MASSDLLEFSPVQHHQGASGVGAQNTLIMSPTRRSRQPDSGIEIEDKDLLTFSPKKPTSSGQLEVTSNEPVEEDGIESDSDDDQHCRLHIKPSKQRQITNKRRADNASFQTWIENNQVEVANSGPKPPSKSQALISVDLLLKGSESRRIIQSPREYQVELFERAKERNTIAVLDTGSGKTLIAALLLRHTLEKEVEDREAGNPKRIAFFLVDKVALVFQQYAVLESNLEHAVARFCGEMVDSMWSKEFWKKQFDENMVIVCTAAILQKCLSHSFIRIDQINLLIFDEAHHAKKNHAYARIMKDHYMPEADPNKRPRVFGMTASPVDADTDVEIAAARLEGLLYSQIATVPEAALYPSPDRKKQLEKQLIYDRLRGPYETELCREVHNIVQHNGLFKKSLVYARNAASQLGPWPADQFWKLWLTNDELSRLTAKTNLEYSDLRYTSEAGSEVQKVHEHIKNHPLLPVARGSQQLSTKVEQLVSILQGYFEKPTDCKCIVFVEQRYTAILLTDLLHQPGIKPKFLKAAPLVGSQNVSGPSMMSFREQILTIAKFKHGDYNCLFATSVAEEGLDIPDCNVIIRFDLFNSMIQYIQSKGRARHQDSLFVNMTEAGNGAHHRKLAQTTYDAAVLRRFCAALPEDRKITGYDTDEARLQGEYNNNKYFIIQSTGSKLTFAYSLEVLSNFVASLRQSDDEDLAPEYVVMSHAKQFVCEVLLPRKSPILNMSGHPQKTKQAARCSAAFEMCVELIKKKFINEHMQPIFTKKLPAMRSARLAISSKKAAEYHMRIKPDAWSRLGPATTLFATVLILEAPEVVGRATRPLVLLSREQLPQLPKIPLFFGNNKVSMARLIIFATPLQVSDADVEALKIFTLRVFKDVFSKEYQADASEIPYFLVPTRQDHTFQFTDIANVESILDWDHIRSTKDLEYLPWDHDTTADFFKDKFVIDPCLGSRKLFLKGVRKDMRALDPVPEGVPDPGHKSWKDVEHNIKEYSVSLWARIRKIVEWRDDQPVVEAELASLRRNLLDEFFEDENEQSKTCYVIIEPLRVSTLPVEFVAMALNFPAIIHRMESNMIALDACKLLNLDIRPDLALEAMTKDSDNSDEHDTEKINFQGGMGNNYERLEFLGDCFLKMATTIALYTQYPDCNEFEYHVERMLLICNQNLFNNAVNKKLQEYVRSKQFSRRTWYPEGLKLKRGKAGSAKSMHALADKSIADVCEALIGAAYLTYTDKQDFNMAIRAVTAVVENKNHKISSYEEYYAAYQMPPWQISRGTAMQRKVASQIKESMGYDFKSPALLRSAFKHPSYPRHYEDLPHYQRLEFLGDALLDMACVDFLFKKFPEADPQWLTEHKMAMVSNHFLGNLCVKLGFHKHILAWHSATQGQIHSYATALNAAREEAEAEGEITGIFSHNYWVNVPLPPKCLPDIVEAYIGAVFVDSCYDYTKVQTFFEAHIRPFFTDMDLYDSFASKHPVTNLTQKLQQEFGCRDWRVMISEVAPTASEAGLGAITESKVLCGILVHGKVYCHAVAASGQYAKPAAAKKAIEKLNEMTVDDFKKEFECYCKPE